jgi:tetratricopeptide (TPR) repeat protein
VSEEGLSASESVARSIALKTPKTAEEQLVQEQIGYLHRQGSLQTAQQALLDLEREGQAFANEGQRIQNVRERLRIVFELALALVVLVVTGIVLELLYSAWHARNVVLSAFDVPPAMEAQGLSGKVVASGLVDQLQKLQSETRSSVARRGINDAWTGDVKLEIPEAHISIGELQRYLHEWLGNETYIGGSMVQGPDNSLILTVRGNGFPAKTFSGKADTLPALTTQAAEYIYGASETYRFAVYLGNHGRNEEAIALVKAAYSTALSSDRPPLLNVWGNAAVTLGRTQEALDRYREAVRLKPDFWVGWSNIVNTQVILLQEEAALQTFESMEHTARRGRWFAGNVPGFMWQIGDLLRWDLPAAHREQVEDMVQTGGHGTLSVEEAPIDAQTLAQMHERSAAELELKTSPGVGTDAYVVAQSSFVRALIALQQGEYAKALPLLQSVDTAVAASADLQSNFTSPPSCWLALAGEWTGAPAVKVDTDVARGGHLVDCYRFKADISDHRGDWPLAQKQYAEAVALAPSVPSSYFSWGEALARHGDYDGAITRFTEANARGPHWADPLKGWGDALAAKQDYKAAVARYAQAEKYAANWGALHLRWGQVLDKLGRHEAAVEHYRKALNLDLTDAERKSLDNCCG